MQTILGLISGNPWLWFILILGVAMSIILFRRPNDRLSVRYAPLFKVDHDEVVRLERADDGNLILSANESLPKEIRVGFSPDPVQHEQVILNDENQSQVIIPSPGDGRRIFVSFTWRDGQSQVVGERLLAVEGVPNIRDFGGYFTVDGRQVRWGQIIRSGALYKMTDMGEMDFGKLGIRKIIDLRTNDEVEEHPDRVPDGVEHWHVPIMDEDPAMGLAVLLKRNRLGELFEKYYVDGILDTGAPRYGEIYRALIDPVNRPANIHCTAGKDRAGMAGAMLLMLLGVPEKTIFEDYSLSNLAMGELIERTRTDMENRMTLGLKVEHFYPMMAASPNLLRAAIEHIDQEYGGIEGYLTGPCGLKGEELDALKEVFLY